MIWTLLFRAMCQLSGSRCICVGDTPPPLQECCLLPGAPRTRTTEWLVLPAARLNLLAWQRLCRAVDRDHCSRCQARSWSPQGDDSHKEQAPASRALLGAPSCHDYGPLRIHCLTDRRLRPREVKELAQRHSRRAGAQRQPCICGRA